PSYWLEVHTEIADSFKDLCAYTAMWLSHAGEIDHLVSIDEDRNRAYDWDNYRYCAGWFNKSKKGLRSSEILDPLQIGDDWFEILLPSLELVVTDRCPEAERSKAEFMLTRLQLGRGSHVMRSRRAFYKKYNEDNRNLEYLDQWAPLLARAIRKQN